MNRVRPFLLCALSLTLASCASFPSATKAPTPSRVDCAIFEGPKVARPQAPLGSRDVNDWVLFGYGMAAWGESILGQRVDSAACVAEENQRRGLR